MQDSWLSSKVGEIQSFADRKHMKKFFDALKTVYGPQSSGTTSLLSADGTSLLTDKEAILKRWAEHFDSVLNRPSSINDDTINRLPQVEYTLLLDEFPTVTETVKAIKFCHLARLQDQMQYLLRSTKHKEPQVEYTLLLDEFPTVTETVKAIKFCHLARLQDQMQYLLRSTKHKEHQLQRRWQSY